jgi:hypothetical protein
MLSRLNFCFVNNKVIIPQNIFFVLVSIGFIFVCCLVYRLFQIQRLSRLRKIILAAGFFAVFIIVTLIIFLEVIIDDDPPSGDYHPLNALIKNRCIVNFDQYCPKNTREAVVWAPDEVKEKLKKASVTYIYYPKTHDYTLIIRNWNYHRNNDRVAIFDSRLKKIKNYERGFDFIDLKIVDNCDGTFRILKPPPLSGPWQKIN